MYKGKTLLYDILIIFFYHLSSNRYEYCVICIFCILCLVLLNKIKKITFHTLNTSISLWFSIHIFRDNKEDIVAYKYA